MTRLLRDERTVLWTAVAVAWLVMSTAAITGHATLVQHDAMLGHGARADMRFVLPLFLAAWTTMVVAMMLPSAMGMLDFFRKASSTRPDRRHATLAFVGGYFVIWLAFGDAALAGDALLHKIVDHSSSLSGRPWLISGGVLALAGAFQFTSLRKRCLHVCRHPAAFLMQRYRPGVSPAFTLGVAHGKFCLGCCWTLMLLMFAAGVANLWWMAGLTVVMVYEKVGRRGDALASIVGVVLLSWALIVFLHPWWAPAAVGGVK